MKNGSFEETVRREFVVYRVRSGKSLLKTLVTVGRNWPPVSTWTTPFILKRVLGRALKCVTLRGQDAKIQISS